MRQIASNSRVLAAAGRPEPRADVVTSRAAVRAALLSARNADGGWPYAPGKGSRLEPTCWALLALNQSERDLPDLRVLREWRRQDNWLADVPGVPPNHAFNALAALTLTHFGATDAALASRLIASKGVKAGQVAELRQDNSLQGWSWIDGTFSWVEPTAWGLIALKLLRSRGAAPAGADARIDEGERLLLDRVCSIGGWNYGNSNVYGQQLWPYVPTTALALLAMRDRRNHSAVERSLLQLQRDAQAERSEVSLALTIIALRAYGIPPDSHVADLMKLSDSAVAGNGDDKNILGLAMTLYALVDARPVAAFSW